MSVDMLGTSETNAEAWFNIALRPRTPEGSLGRTAQDGHLHFMELNGTRTLWNSMVPGLYGNQWYLDFMDLIGTWTL